MSEDNGNNLDAALNTTFVKAERGTNIPLPVREALVQFQRDMYDSLLPHLSDEGKSVMEKMMIQEVSLVAPHDEVQSKTSHTPSKKENVLSVSDGRKMETTGRSSYNSVSKGRSNYDSDSDSNSDSEDYARKLCPRRPSYYALQRPPPYLSVSGNYCNISGPYVRFGGDPYSSTYQG